MAWLSALAVLCCFIAQAQSAAPRLITHKIDETRLTTLPGHIHPAANAANDRGPVDDNAPVGHIVLLLKRTGDRQLALDALVDQLHNAKSKNYQQWLTPQEFGRRFGPSDEDVAVVAGWLESKGFTIEDAPPSKTHITFTGTVGQMRQAFHIDIHHLSVNGEAHQATMNEPQIPSALAPVVSGFKQLHDFGPRPLNRQAGVFRRDAKSGKLKPAEGMKTAPRANFTNVYNSEDFYEVGPQDFYTIYNENPLLSQGINGAGVTIAVIEETQINPADPVSFRSQFGLAAYPGTPNSTAGGINYIYGSSSGVGGDSACTAPLTVAQGNSSGDEGEAALDVEWAGATAPNAIIDFVACGTASEAIGSYGTDLAAAHIANYLSSTVTAASLSYGECEAVSGSSSFYTNLWEQYAAQGQTAIVSAGDGGSLGCETLTNNTSVNIMADSAYNISAGGTDFGDTYITNNYTTSPATTWWSATNGAGLSSALSYIPETTWGGYCSNALLASYLKQNGVTTFGTTYTPEAICNNSTANSDGFRTEVGGSGGVSTSAAIPTWQSVYGIGLDSSSTTHRNQPDISLFAANGFWGHALPYCESDVVACGFSTAVDAYDLEAGGTSFVAPQLAGLIALVNQQTGMRQGQANYTLYNLAAQEYGTTSTPNTTNLANCSGSALGASVGSSCIFQDIAADTPSLQGGTIASQIIEPCTYSKVTDCYRSTNSDTYGLSAVTGASHSSTLAYYAGAGYDVATGLGSVNVYNLIANWNTVSPGFASTTTLTASASTVSYSTTANLTLTATVKATGRGGAVAPAGVVEFFDGGSTSGTLLGSGSIASNCTGTGASTSCDGVATLALASSTLTPGANSMVAYFEGDAANDAASTSKTNAVTVNNWPQTITITSANTATYGAPLTLTATSTSGLTTFTYSVISGPATVKNGVLTFTGVGTVVAQASQAGNSTYAAATAQQSITVNPASPTLSVATSGTPSTYGGSVTFTATISSGPTGTVTFYDSGTSIGTGTISGTTAKYVTATLTAGTHSITAGWPGNANYNSVTSSAITQTVNQATPTITWAAPTAITYGTALSATQLDATASVPGTFVYTPASGTVLTAGSQSLSVAFTPTDSTDYTSASKTVTLTVNKATPTITWATPAAITYGTALSATQLDATASVPGTFVYTPASGTVLTAGSQSLSVAFTPTDTTDYNTASKTVTLTVNKAIPTITWATPAAITYGTALSATQLDTTANVPGTFVYTPASGTVPTAGSKTLSVTFTPTDTTDYTTPTTTVTLTVNKATPTITWATPAAITYGTALSATQLNATASVPGTFVYSPASGKVLKAGSQTLSVTFTPTDSTDYTSPTATVTLTVNQATPTITWANPKAITYGTALSATQLNATANTPGAFVYSPVSGTVLTAGSQTLSVTFTPTDTTDYTTANATVALTVNQATPTITWAKPAAITYPTALSATQLNATANVPGSFVYTPVSGTVLTAGSQTLSVTFTPTDTTDYTSASKTVTLTVNKATPTITWAAPAAITYGTALSATQLNATANVPGAFVYTPASGTVPTAGSQTLSATFTPTDTTDYNTANKTVTLTVNKATPTITWAAPAAITYGTALSATQLDASANTAGSFVYTPASGAILTPGSTSLSVTFTPTDTTDYNNANKTVSLTVNRAPLTVVVNNAVGTYGSALPAFTGSVSGLVNGDTYPGTVTLSFSTTASSTSPYSDAGAYSITATVGGSVSSNYTVTSNTPGTLTISPAPLTIVVNNAAGTYGSALPTFTSTLTGLVNGDSSTDVKGVVHRAAVKRHANELGGSADDLTIDYATTANSSSPYSDAGSYTITATLDGAGAGNYTVTSNTPGTLTIAPAPLTVVVNNASGTYGSALPTFTSTLSGLVNGDSSTDVKGVVHRAVVKHHANELGGSADDLTIDYVTTANSSSPYSDAGTYPITATLDGAGAGNYTVTSNTPGTLTIAPAPLTIVVNDATETYGSALPTFTSTLTGLVNGDSSADVKGVVHRAAVKHHANELGGLADDLTIDYATPASSSSPYSDAGTYPITATLDGAGAGNYAVTSNTPGTLTIAPAPLTVVVNNATGTYGSALPTFTSTLTGLVNGDSSADVKGVVHRAAVKHHANESGGSADDLTIDYATTANSSSPYSDAGTYPITATLDGAGVGNYAVTSNTPGTLTISPAPLTVVVNNATGTYGSALPTFTSTLTGLVNGDSSADVKGVVHRAAVKHHANESGGSAQDLTIDYATTANSSSPYSPAGTYPITATLDGAAAANYIVTSNTPGTLTILATQTITFTPPSTVQYGIAPLNLSSYASASSGLPVTFQLTSGPASLSGSVLTITGAGPIVVQASQGGNAVYAAANPVSAGITVNPILTPAAGSILPGTSATFTWNAGAGPTAYQLMLGTTGPGSSNLYSSGSMTSTSITVNGLPLNGATVYATLCSMVNGVWQPAYYTYTQAGLAAITSPTPGTIIPGSATFNWTAGSGVTSYFLSIGTVGPGSANLWESGPIAATSVKASGLPLNGTALYVTLFSMINGTWMPSYYTYAEAAPATMTSPTPGSILPGSATFTWTPGNGVTAYFLSIGTNGAGSANIWESGSTTATSVQAKGLPLNSGTTLYATLFSMINGAWQPTYYTYSEAGLAAMTSPTPGSIIPGSATFTWTAGNGATAYFLSLGTNGAGSANVWESGSITATSVQAKGLPLDGATLYATLFSMINGVWQPTYYTYTEAGLAVITSPAPATALPGSSATFSWTAGSGATAYFLSVGTNGAGSANVWESGSTTATSVTATGLPMTGGTVYVTLFSMINGAWQPAYYSYTAAQQAAVVTLAPQPLALGSPATVSDAPSDGPAADQP